MRLQASGFLPRVTTHNAHFIPGTDSTGHEHLLRAIQGGDDFREAQVDICTPSCPLKMYLDLIILFSQI